MIPIHLLTRIFSYLLIHDQIRCMQMCSLVYNCAPQWVNALITFDDTKFYEIYCWLDKYKNVSVKLWAVNQPELKLIVQMIKKCQIKEVYLSDNEIPYSRLSHGICELYNLQILDASYNSLTYIPKSIYQLQNLEKLDLSGNHLSSLPESICQLQNLKILDISVNYLKSVPDSISELANLKELNVSENYSLQCLPDTIEQLKNLKKLCFLYDRLASLPISIKQVNSEILEYMTNQVLN